MSTPSTREQFKDWCLRELGWPVININVDDDQVEDRIDEAFQYFRDFHYDGVERWYLPHQITQTDIDNKYISIPDNIIGITRIFSISSATVRNMFDLQYQMRLNDLTLLTTGSIVYFHQMQQHLRLLDMTFNGEQPVRFNRTTGKVYIDMSWDKVTVGQYIVMEGFIIIDPDVYAKLYNDRMLKKLATAYIKRQWSVNLKKYGGMQLPGGVTLNGKEMYDEAMVEIKELEELIRNTFEEPPLFMVGTWVSFFINTSIGSTLLGLMAYGTEAWNYIPMA